MQTGVFIPEKSNIWRDCCDGMYDWVKEHVMEVRGWPFAAFGEHALSWGGVLTVWWEWFCLLL